MDDLIYELKSILDKHHIWYQYEEKSNERFIFHWNTIMRDAGLAADNVILDLIIDHQHGGVFLGLIRIPPPFRGKGIGMELVEAMKLYAKEQHYLVLLESAPENLAFWRKEHFSSFLYEDYGLWLMGYGGGNKQLLKAKWLEMKPCLYSDAS